MYDTVQAGLINGHIESLQKIYLELLNSVRAARKCSVTELLSAINSSEFSVSRNISVGHFVPSYGAWNAGFL